ncbi:hypothetical protein BDZ89DRAFT_1161014 [Hymenopellis radicata]|nr:hypothetical protein BDZ89DRAFT_1161014 [Hymenopellis radicata]
MSANLNTSVEFCPKCRASMTLKSYTLPFATNVARAYHNLSRSDAFALESGLSDPSAESAALAVEIRRVKALLATLKKHSAHLDHHIRQTRMYTTHSPIRQFPTEILTLIFAFACTSYEPEYHKTPLSISLVCSKWRDIAMAAPRLWTNIYAGPEPEARALFKYYLERCGELPISLKIDKPCIADRAPPSNLEDSDGSDLESTPDEGALAHPSPEHMDAMHEIYSTFRCWVAVEFHVQKEDLFLLANHTTKQGLGLPILDGLLVHAGFSFLIRSGGAKRRSGNCHFGSVHDPMLRITVHNFDKLPSAFQNAPRLICLDVNQDGGRLWPYSGLPTNVSEKRTNQECLDYLVTSSRSLADNEDGNSTLVVYTLCPLVSDFVRLGKIGSLRSSSITHLVFNSNVWTPDLKCFLELAYIPSLKVLTIVARDPADTDGCENERSWSNLLEAVPTFLNNSTCVLESFNLTMHGTLVQALQAMPKLQSLTVIEATSGPPLLTELIPEMTGHSLIPQLEALELVWAEDRHPDDSLMTMLSSRVGDGEGTLGLSSVVLGRRNGGEFMPTVIAHLQELRKSGVRASLW